MDGSGNVKFDWGDGEHSFRLAMKQLRELQDKTGIGPEALYERIRSGSWHIADLREPIRLGLIGGGMDEVAASKIMRTYFDDGPYLKHKPAAVTILLSALLGPPEDKVEQGKAERGREQSESPSPSISESLAPSA
ncbi:MAG TPA: gene transfer agent family protein [Pirellulales bacterium]|jgi:hypothetical protein